MSSTAHNADHAPASTITCRTNSVTEVAGLPVPVAPLGTIPVRASFGECTKWDAKLLGDGTNRQGATHVGCCLTVVVLQGVLPNIIVLLRQIMARSLVS